MAVEKLINKASDQVYFKIHRSENGSGSVVGSSARSDMTCYKCGKKGHTHKDCRSKVNGSGGNPPKKSTNDLPEWVTKKPILSDTKDLTTSTMTHNNKKYKWCTYLNNGQGSWVFRWKDGHEEWKNKQVNKPSVCFSNPVTDAVIYCSYLMTTSEDPTEEESKGGYDSKSNGFISLSGFELLE